MNQSSFDDRRSNGETDRSESATTDTMTTSYDMEQTESPSCFDDLMDTSDSWPSNSLVQNTSLSPCYGIAKLNLENAPPAREELLESRGTKRASTGEICVPTRSSLSTLDSRSLQPPQPLEERSENGATNRRDVESAKSADIEKEKSNDVRPEPPTVDISQINAYTYYAEKTDLPPGVIDIDREMLEYPTCYSHYTHDTFKYLRQRERLFRGQRHVDEAEVCPSSRESVIDWMVQLHEDFQFTHETLYLAVKIINRYLSIKPLLKTQLRLLAASALLIASKLDQRYGETNIDSYVTACGGDYKRREFLEMELDILSVLDFDISIPISYTFLRRYCQSLAMSMEEMSLARFILEASLLSYDVMQLLDSHVAAAALLLALEVLGKSWDQTLAYYTGYEHHELVCTRNRLNKMIHAMKDLQSRNELANRRILNKYSDEVFFQVARKDFPPPEIEQEEEPPKEATG